MCINNKIVHLAVSLFALVLSACGSGGAGTVGNSNTVGRSGTPGAAGTVTTLRSAGNMVNFNFPMGITTDGTNLYVADSANNRLCQVSIASGQVTILAGSGAIGAVDGTGTAASFWEPIGMATDGANLYVADSANNKIRKIDILSGQVTTLAGSGVRGMADGVGPMASFANPLGIAIVGPNLYVADIGNNMIRKVVTATGQVSTLAGSGTMGTVDGIGFAANFHFPAGIATDGTNLYVSDAGNNKIRKIAIATAQVTTLAGSGLTGSTDGNGTAASFNYPMGITANGANLYVADSSGNRVRAIAIATAQVSTLAGNGVAGMADGVGIAVSFNNPHDVVNVGTNLYVADSANGVIRIVAK